MIVFDARCFDKSVRQQQRAESHYQRIPGNLGNDHASSRRSELGGDLKEKPFADSRTTRSWSDQNRIEHGCSNGTSDHSKHAETYDFTIALSDTRSILAVRFRNGRAKQITRSLNPWIFFALPFNQRKRDGKIFLARRVNDQTLQSRGKHRAVWCTTYICSDRPSTPSAASLTASERVGCECTVIPTSSDEPRYSKASTTS